MDIVSSISGTLSLAKKLKDISKTISEAEFQQVLADLISELSLLKIEVAQLKEENHKLKTNLDNFKNEKQDREAYLRNLARLLENEKVLLPEYLRSEDKKENDLFSILVNIQKELILGISNVHSQEKAIYWKFDHICPKLELYGIAYKERMQNSDVKTFFLSNVGKEILNKFYQNKLKIIS